MGETVEKRWIMDSLELAEKTGKRHYDVLKDIKGEMSTKDLTGVEESVYKTIQGKMLLKSEEAVKQMISRWSSKAASCLVKGGSIQEALNLCKTRERTTLPI